jgi:competence protein ComEC
VLRVRTLFRREAPLAEALLVAYRESLDTALRDDFAASGLTHLLAISGSHVGILAAVVLLLARIARLRQRAAALLATAVSVAYVLFLGAPAAAARAALQSMTLLASRITQRPAEPLALLACAALVLMAVDPLVLLDIGFQLSFAGVFGLIAFGPAARRILKPLPPAIASALGATLAATFTTTPIVAWHFGLVSFVAPLANLVAGPLMALAVPALIAAMAIGAVHTGLGHGLAGGAEVLLRLLRQTAHLAAALPWGHAWVAGDAITAALLATVAFLVFAPRRHPLRGAGRAGTPPRRHRRLVLYSRVASGLTLLVIFPLLHPTGNGTVEIHAIDVGQGDAFAIRSPRGRWILVDAGPLQERFDAGRDRVVPYLLKRGVHVIDLVILTHPHADHIGGVQSVWRRIPVRAVIDPAVSTGAPLYLDVLAAARQSGRRWVAGRAGREVRVDDMTLRILAPEDSLLDGLGDPNDFSVVFRLEYGRFAALFLGDAPRRVENRLVARVGSGLHAAVLKVGHHGSRTATGDSLLQAVQPRLAFVPVGRRNRYGHPNPGVMERLQRYGVRIVRTDESGSVMVRGRADGTMQLLTSR